MGSNRQIWIYVVLGLLVVDFVVFGYLPASRQLEAMQRSITAERRARQLADAQRRHLPSLRQRLSWYQAQVEAYKAKIPSDLQMAGLLQQLSGLMEGRLTAQVLVPTEPQLIDGLYRTKIHLSCQGRLVDVFGFLQDIARMERLVVVEQLRLNNDQSLTGHLQAQMELVVFHQPLG